MNVRFCSILTAIVALLSSFLFVLKYNHNNLLPSFKANKSTSSLIFWAHTLHEGCRVDTATLLQGLNQTVIAADHNQRKNPYATEYTRPGILFLEDKRPLSPFMYSHQYHSVPVFEHEVREFFKYYSKDPTMQSVNAFYCSFPSSYCEIYMPFNRTIIWLPAHRFTLSRCSRKQIDRLILHMQQSVRPDQQPKHFVAAGGRYDQEYIKYYTGLNALLLPINSLWYAFNVTNFTQTRIEILVGPLQKREHPLIATMVETATALNASLRFATAKSLYGQYQLQQIANHRAVVLLPYAVLTYGITELYALAIPLFVPTIDFIVQLQLVFDRTILDSFYCGGTMKFEDLPKQHPNSNHSYSPEDKISPDALRYWLQFADYYQLPHIQTFSSWENLIHKLSKTNFQQVHDDMYKENLRRKDQLTEKWQTIFAQIDRTQRTIPNDYDTAIRQLWNTTSLLTI